MHLTPGFLFTALFWHSKPLLRFSRRPLVSLHDWLGAVQTVSALRATYGALMLGRVVRLSNQKTVFSIRIFGFHLTTQDGQLAHSIWSITRLRIPFFEAGAVLAHME
jgi:hypothetical protein